MLNIIFGRENVPKELVPKVVLDCRPYFRWYKQPEWFEDPFVKEFLKVVDGTEVLFQEALKDYRGKGISTEMISTGCKNLCCIYYDINSEHIFFGTQLGDNCLPFLARIAEKRDVTIFLEHFADFPSECFKSTDIRCNGKRLTEEEYEDAYCDWCATTQKDDYFDRVCNSGI